MGTDIIYSPGLVQTTSTQKARAKPNVGIPAPFEPFIDAGHVALARKGFLAPPSDWPGPDRTCGWLKSSRYNSRLQVGFHPVFGFNRTIFWHVRPQSRLDQVW